MRKCDAENRQIPDDEKAYAVSHPRIARIYLVTDKGLAKNIPRCYWCEDDRLKVDKWQGLNFHEPIFTPSGEVKLGKQVFHIDVLILMKFPGLYSLYFRWPWQK